MHNNTHLLFTNYTTTVTTVPYKQAPCIDVFEMTNIGSVVIVAVNAVFAVCLDRREDFLQVFHNQVNNHANHNTGLPSQKNNEVQAPALIQVVLGEDLEIPGTFHCHLKYEFASIQDAQDAVRGSSIERDEASVTTLGDSNDDRSKKISSIFLNGRSQEWMDFEARSPFRHDAYDGGGITSHAWIVAPRPSPPPSTASMSLTAKCVPNPKLSLIKKGDTEVTHSTNQQQQLFCLNANLHIQPRHREALLALLEDARAASIQEPLCAEYQYGESMTQPNTFHVHQAYTGANGGKEGFDRHAKTPHYQRWKDFAAGSAGDADNNNDDNEDNSPFTRAPIGYPFRAPIFSDPEDGTSDKKTSAGESASSHYDNVIFLDGGIGHELKQRGIVADDGSFLAGMVANEKQPDVVKDVHGAFCRSGCQVLTTNSFVAVPQRVQQDFYSDSKDSNGDVSNNILKEETVLQRTRDLIHAAVKCARDVATNENEPREGYRIKKVAIAGTVPPLTECYIAAVVPQQLDILVASYSFLLSTLVEEGVDLLLGETLSTTREGIAIIRALSDVLVSKPKQSRLPLWLSFTVDDFIQPTVLRSNESLERAVDSVLDEAKIRGINLGGIGVNCTSPSAVSKAIPILANCARRHCLTPTPRILAYANAFQTTTTEWLLASGQIESLVQVDESLQKLALCSKDDYDQNGLILPEVYANYAERWRNSGASIIGGCCGCSPAHMRAVSNKFASRSLIDHKNFRR